VTVFFDVDRDGERSPAAGAETGGSPGESSVKLKTSVMTSAY
jgi:hypothetical protein